MNFSDSWVERKAGLTATDLDKVLGEALSKGGDYADLYFESTETTAVSLDEQIVKSASQGFSMGCGVRVLSGERTGYGYTAELSMDRLLKAAATAACIAAGPAQVSRAGFEPVTAHRLYEAAGVEASLKDRVDLIRRADEAARSADARVIQVMASYADSVKQVMVATSGGRIVWDTQPMARLNVQVIASEESGQPQQGYSGGGGRVDFSYFLTERTPEEYAREAVRQAIVQLDAGDAPAGEMTVVLGPGWPGILLHEAVGHGLEADFNRKGVSAFSGRVGQKVASELCTVVDDGTMAKRRGSLNVDDEGVPTSRTVLIENGILRGYLQDRLSSRLLGSAPTGNGRRESYHYTPMPRMTNTFMLAGESDPAEIVRSVKSGVYCANFGGGQVDITSGNFVFSATESYLIEDGKLTRPLRGASLIGNGPEALKHVSMVGNDLKLDEGVGICGKEGQSVPVGVGIPTVRIDHMTVGGGK
jgi:TldD protein